MSFVKIKANIFIIIYLFFIFPGTLSNPIIRIDFIRGLSVDIKRDSNTSVKERIEGINSQNKAKRERS